MKYKPKNVSALQIALGGLPDKMRVRKDSRRTSEGNGVARELGHSSPAGAPPRKRGNGKQGDRRNSILAKAVARFRDAANARDTRLSLVVSPGTLAFPGMVRADLFALPWDRMAKCRSLIRWSYSASEPPGNPV